MQKRYKYDIKDIAKLLTDDPDVFAEARPGGNRRVEGNITVRAKPKVKVASKDVRDKITVKPKSTAMPQPQPTQPGETRTMKKLDGEDGETTSEMCESSFCNKCGDKLNSKTKKCGSCGPGSGMEELGNAKTRHVKRPKNLDRRPTSESAPTHLCRNSVYRRGTVAFCMRPTHQRICVECKGAREALAESFLSKNKCKKCGAASNDTKATKCKSCGAPMTPDRPSDRLAQQEAEPESLPTADYAKTKTSQYYKTESKSKKKSSKKKTKKTKKTKSEKFDSKFKVHDGLNWNKKGPDKVNKKQKRKSPLQKGPIGSKQSKKSPYLK